MSYPWQDTRDAVILNHEQVSGDSNVASGTTDDGPRTGRRLAFKKEVGTALLKHAEDVFPDPEVTSPTNPSHDY